MELIEAQMQTSLNQLKSLENKLSDLREKYSRNQYLIKEAENKSINSKDFEKLQKRDNELTKNLAKLEANHELYKNFLVAVSDGVHPILLNKALKIDDKTNLIKLIEKQLSELEVQRNSFEIEKQQLATPLKVAQEAELFLSKLEILRSREIEIGDEGKRLKEEMEGLEHIVHNSKIKLNNVTKINPNVNEEKQRCNAGSNLLRIAKFLFSDKTYREVFQQQVGDWREEYSLALKEFRLLRAVWISARNYVDFIYNMMICSRFGEAFEFIVKLIGIVGIFLKFWK